MTDKVTEYGFAYSTLTRQGMNPQDTGVFSCHLNLDHFTLSNSTQVHVLYDFGECGYGGGGWRGDCVVTFLEKPIGICVCATSLVLFSMSLLQKLAMRIVLV